MYGDLPTFCDSGRKRRRMDDMWAPGHDISLPRSPPEKYYNKNYYRGKTQVNVIPTSVILLYQASIAEWGSVKRQISE